MFHAHSNAHKLLKTVAPILAEMYCSHQYLLIAPKTPRPLERPQTAHKLEEIVNMNVNISETINDREIGFRLRSLVRSAS